MKTFIQLDPDCQSGTIIVTLTFCLSCAFCGTCTFVDDRKLRARACVRACVCVCVTCFLSACCRQNMPFGGAYKTFWFWDWFRTQGFWSVIVRAEPTLFGIYVAFKACSNSRLCQNLTYLVLEHELDLKLKKFYKHRPWAHNAAMIYDVMRLVHQCIIFTRFLYLNGTFCVPSQPIIPVKK